MNNFTIKTGPELTEEELDQLTEIDCGIPHLYDENFPPINAEVIAERRKYLKDNINQGLFQVVFSGNQMIAFHILQPRGYKTVNVTTLWVHPNFRKSGLAKELKEAGVAWARSQGMEFISTNVNKNNQRMLEINQKAGFEVVSYAMRLKL